MGKEKALLAERGRGEKAVISVSNAREFRSLEQHAFDHPSARDEIIGALEAYAKKHRGRSQAVEMRAKAAAQRIAALTMLEMLHDGSD